MSKVAGLKLYCELLSYCLMPNHFHLMIFVPPKSAGLHSIDTRNPSAPQVLSRKIGTMLSSYTRAFNLEFERVGSLFQPKTKAIEMDEVHSAASFHYIHQNPLRGGLVNKMENWPYSSFIEYLNNSEGFCNRELAFNLLDIPRRKDQFYQESYSIWRE